MDFANLHPVHRTFEPRLPPLKVPSPLPRIVSLRFKSSFDVTVYLILHARQNFRFVHLILLSFLCRRPLAPLALWPSPRELNSFFLGIFARVVSIVEGSLGVVPAA
jgi:hypothetical protein